MARVVVIGGGLSGLTAAFKLARAKHRVLVVESAPALGGQIQTERRAGFVVELGGEGFVARSEALPKLAHKLGIEAELMGQAETRSLGFRDGELIELQPGEAAKLLGFQVARDDEGQGIRTFRRGMGSLIDALQQKLASDVEIRTGFRVRQIERRSREYEIRGDRGVSVLAERLVIATAARAAGELVAPMLGTAAFAPDALRTQSSVTISLAFPRGAIRHALDATGCVIAAQDQLHGARACAFCSTRFAERAPEDYALLRVFIRPDPREIKTLSDASYVARAHEVLSRIVGFNAAPAHGGGALAAPAQRGGALAPAEHSWVSRWPDALPVFDTATKQAVATLETALKGSGIALAGSAFHGSGIDAAVRSAWSVDERW